jgi:MYXO-CTERM domain-containing protein
VAAEAFGLTGCDEHEFSPEGQNANVVLFHDTVWPYEDAEDSVGLTTTTFNDQTGAIVDADIEINATVPLSTTDAVAVGSYDLLSIMTHEVGHFLGLAHSREPGATMGAIYEPGSDDFRTLSDDDVAGICAIYAPDRPVKECDFTPVGGFAAECALGVVRGGCSVRPGGANHGWYFGAMALGFWAVRRRRRTGAPGLPLRRSESRRVVFSLSSFK